MPFSLWTSQRLADYIAKQTGIRVEGETARRQLKDARFVPSRPQHTISSPVWRAALKKTFEETRDDLEEGDVFYNADERVQPELDVPLQAMWSPKGQRAIDDGSTHQALRHRHTLPPR